MIVAIPPLCHLNVTIIVNPALVKPKVNRSLKTISWTNRGFANSEQKSWEGLDSYVVLLHLLERNDLQKKNITI